MSYLEVVADCENCMAYAFVTKDDKGNFWVTKEEGGLICCNHEPEGILFNDKPCPFYVKCPKP